MAVNHRRVCSDCGAYFHDWKHQDNEGANCPRCTVKILRKEVKEYHISIDLLCTSLNDANQAKLRSMPFLTQRIIVEEAFRDGILTHHIR
jgi:DNA-directed RNA polymerase subunit RPC12/RpoP